MHILFYSTASLFESRFLLLLDEAMCHEKAGDQVTFVYCDGCLNCCRSNISGSAIVCAVCRRLSEMAFKRLPPEIDVRPLSRFLSPSDAAEVDQTPFRYASARELQEIEFRSVDIGYAVLSHYIGMRRNLDPTLTPALVRLFNSHLRAAARLTAAAENIVKTCRADCYGLFNGRLFDTRGFMRIAMRQKGGECRCYEMVANPSTHETQSIFFVNALPHNIRENARLIEDFWNQAARSNTLEALNQIGAQFFEKRQNNQPTTDPVVYSRNQIAGTLPANWSADARNFVFFNSSEDEYASIDREYDQFKYLPNQTDVIRKVASLAQQADPSIRIYLRIHPNLAAVKFAYHQELADLDKTFSNLTVIPATSPISTYTLIKQAEKVIVVGSTVGIEAVFSGKPVILLGPAAYRHLDACYVPQNEGELQKLLKEPLAPKDRSAAMMYGYYMLSANGKHWQHFDFSISKKQWGCMRVPYASCYRLFGSPFLFGFVYRLVTSVLFIPYHVKRSKMRRLGLTE